MRHFIYGLIIGVLTIAFSIYILSDSNDGYESDIEFDKEIALQETFEGANYNITPQSFACDKYEREDETIEGCVLNVELTNTSVFDHVLILDGDFAVAADGSVYPSSAELSKELVENNGLVGEIQVEETVTGGIFFEIPAGVKIVEVQMLEVVGADPIIVRL